MIQEQPDFLVVNKEAGIDMHDDAGVPGLVSRVSAFLGQDVYPVHRLDKVTSGLVLLAKNKEATRLLSQSFADREVKKIYLAISDRAPKKKQGWIKGDMVKGRNGSWRLQHSCENPALLPGSGAFALALPRHRVYIGFSAQKNTSDPCCIEKYRCAYPGDERYGGCSRSNIFARLAAATICRHRISCRSTA